MSGQIARPTVLERLASHLAQPVDTNLRHRATWHLTDWIGCAIAARVENVADVLRAGASDDPLSLAFVWGGLGNVLEMDDVDKRALLHPGPSIVPAALAIGFERGSSANDLLDAIVLGYEATLRLGRAAGQGHYALWHSTGTCGSIGAAAAASRLLHLSTEHMAHAMALAVSQSAGLWQTRHEAESMGKQLHTAHAARAGAHAALLAARGMRGPLTILEGEQGFFAAMCPDGDPFSVIRDQRFGSITDVSFKPWPACRHAHAAIDAALLLREDVWQDAETIKVSSYSDALKFCDQPDPGSTIEAKFSLQHAVAVTLLHGKPRLSDFNPDRIGDPDIASLRKRVTVAIDPAIDDAFPARFGAKIEADDQVHVVRDALGDPENPLSPQQLIEKARMLMVSGSVDELDATALGSLCLDLSDQPNLENLQTSLRGLLP